MRQILCSFRLDLHRLNSQGKGTLLFILLGLPAFMVLLNVAMGAESSVSAAASGGTMGGVVGALAVMPMNIFAYENQGQGRWLNGLIPVSRSHQVAGRYATLLMFALLVLVECVLCLGIAALISGQPWSGEATRTVLASTIGYLVAEAIAYPMLYRFQAQQAMLMLFGGLIGLGVALVALVWLAAKVLPAAALAALAAWSASVGDLLAGGMVWVAPLAIAAALLVLAVSFAISLRIYRHKEL